MKDTKARLEQAHKGDVTCSDVRNALMNAQTLLTDYVNHICSCLPEAEKPKLRHGDIRVWHHSVDKLVSVIDLSGHCPYAIWLADDLRNKWTEEQILSRSTSIGNLKDVFDHLTALAEMPSRCSVNINMLTDGIEAEVDTFTGSGNICIRIGESGTDKTHYMKPYNVEDVAKFQRELGGVIANARKKMLDR